MIGTLLGKPRCIHEALLDLAPGLISCCPCLLTWHQVCRPPFCWLLQKVIMESFFFFFLTNLFIYFWLCWVFVSVRGLSPVAVSGGHSSSRCAGPSLSRPLPLRSTGSRRAGSVIVAHGPSCSAACGILPDQGSNPCPLHWQADSQPLRHQGSPSWSLYCPLSHAYVCIIYLWGLRYQLLRESFPDHQSRVISAVTLCFISLLPSIIVPVTISKDLV